MSPKLYNFLKNVSQDNILTENYLNRNVDESFLKVYAFIKLKDSDLLRSCYDEDAGLKCLIMPEICLILCIYFLHST